MKKTILACAAVMSITAVLSAQNAQDILTQAERILYPDSFYAKSSLTTKSPGKTNVVMEFESIYKKNIGTLMEMLSPARSKGIRFLEKSGNLWMFNPKAQSRNAIRLSPRSSFQGSVFSNNDLSDTTYSDNYTTTIAGSESIDHPELGRVECLVLEGTASSELSAYARIKMWVRKTDYLPLRVQYFAHSGLLFKQMTLSGIKYMAGRTRPTVITMESLEQKGRVSVMVFEQMELRENLADSQFSETALTR